MHTITNRKLYKSIYNSTFINCIIYKNKLIPITLYSNRLRRHMRYGMEFKANTFKKGKGYIKNERRFNY